ncbi:MAG TPA: VRR-NUC domain-containing protein [Thermodesulfobacteriota bacterium]|nr:VRR-NUC domain-containing protein [Thermodesulfobacteriota bacterium]HNU71835.1 VRR-NUC domain-containing protein [Thermodesulfobacteriota bacterium]
MKRKPVYHKPERDITIGIRNYLNFKRIFHYKHWQGPLSGMKGVADIIGIYRGRFLAIEVKKPGEKPTRDQEIFLTRVNHEGGFAFVAHSVDDVIRVIQSIEGILTTKNTEREKADEQSGAGSGGEEPDKEDAARDAAATEGDSAGGVV